LSVLSEQDLKGHPGRNKKEKQGGAWKIVVGEYNKEEGLEEKKPSALSIQRRGGEVNMESCENEQWTAEPSN